MLEEQDVGGGGALLTQAASASEYLRKQRGLQEARTQFKEAGSSQTVGCDSRKQMGLKKARKKFKEAGSK